MYFAMSLCRRVMYLKKRIALKCILECIYVEEKWMYMIEMYGKVNCNVWRGGGLGSRPKKNVRGVFGGWGRVPFNEPYAPLLSTIYDGA